MAEAFVFNLTAVIGAMGGVAVGERRIGWDRPGRSAVFGLVAACLGLERQDDEAHLELNAAYGLGLRQEEAGGPLLIDFHTAQVPPTRRGARYATRAEELASPQLETVLSQRDYRLDLSFTAALWRRSVVCRWTFDDLARALNEPTFVPYLGRKSCALSMPMFPQVVHGVQTLADAFRRYDQIRADRRIADLARSGQRFDRRLHQPKAHGLVWADRASEGELPLGLVVHRSETRRDGLASRRRWQFALREEQVADWSAKPQSQAEVA